jgi:hypothetical protein
VDSVIIEILGRNVMNRGETTKENKKRRNLTPKKRHSKLGRGKRATEHVKK